MPTNADIWRERNGTAQRIAQGVASGYTPSDVQSGDRFYVLPPGEQPVGPGAPKPLLQNLQLFSDYEAWTAGDPLPNRYPDKSGITSLTDNNTVGSETTSPLVGGKSGSYDDASQQYHSAALPLPASTGKDFYVSLWLRLDKIQGTNDQGIFGAWDEANILGFFLDQIGGKLRFATGDGTFSGGDKANRVDVSNDAGRSFFVECIYRSGVNEAVCRVDDGAQTHTFSAKYAQPSSLDFRVGARQSQDVNLDGVIDNFAYEVADQGELNWPSASTWLYNSGAGRSWSEIQNYIP